VSIVELPGNLVYSTDGLLPVVAQDHSSGDVLMVAWANVEAVRLTAETGEAHFWSRTRQRLWKKGESSGHILHVREARTDCDRDTLLLIVDPEGPACHTGVRTCFGEGTATRAGVLTELQRVIAERAATRPEGSYTSRLLAKGLDHTLKKIGEEATEVVLAAKGESDERLAEESADLLFHLLVALQQRGLGPSEVLDVLARRRADMSKSKTS
jgi:phosphoribosyl-AMP cyclohydrolase / phosphoribosyl-ATP pyrophosphohydrolase